MKRLRFFKMLVFLPLGCVLVGCRALKNGELTTEQKKQEPFYDTQQNQPKNWEAEALWEEKIKPLSETKIPSFNDINELSKEYIFKLACYRQVMSPEGLVYDKRKQKYVIDETDVQYFAKDLLGIDEFDFRESGEYNKNNGVYECSQYPDYEILNRRYKDPKLEKVSDSQWKFSLDVFEGDEVAQEDEDYITEVYLVEDSASGYKLLSVHRLDSQGQEVLEQTSAPEAEPQ